MLLDDSVTVLCELLLQQQRCEKEAVILQADQSARHQELNRLRVLIFLGLFASTEMKHCSMTTNLQPLLRVCFGNP